MNLDELRNKIEEICNKLNNQALDAQAKTKLQNELEETCIRYYNLRRISA